MFPSYSSCWTTKLTAPAANVVLRPCYAMVKPPKCWWWLLGAWAFYHMASALAKTSTSRETACTAPPRMFIGSGIVVVACPCPCISRLIGMSVHCITNCAQFIAVCRGVKPAPVRLLSLGKWAPLQLIANCILSHHAGSCRERRLHMASNEHCDRAPSGRRGHGAGDAQRAGRCEFRTCYGCAVSHCGPLYG